MRGQDLLSRMREQILIGDGAIGTMISEKGFGRETNYERLNLTHPDFIREIHASYVAAGAELLETNTFGANRTKLAQFNVEDDVAAINREGVLLARSVAGGDTFIAGAVGPLANAAGPQELAPPSDDEIRSIFEEPILALADAGADLIILETFTDLRQLLLALHVVKAKTDLPNVCQMAFHERGHTYAGVHVHTALNALLAAGADVVGANCGRGVRCVVSAVAAISEASNCLISAFPNAGLPEYVDGRYLYGAPLPYLVESASQMADLGVNLIGGCCGTTPAYISCLSERLKGRQPAARVHKASATTPAETGASTGTPRPVPPAGSIFEGWNTERPDRPLVVVELDPPRGLHYEAVVRRAQQLRDMGVDAITMADNPVATLRMGNMALAQIVQKEAGIPVIVHLTCRDHNLLGLQSLLMAADVMGLNHLLALTGDPARVGDQPGATSVYDLNSFGLIELIGKFNQGFTNTGISLGRPTNFTVGVAFNPNGRNLPGQVARLRKKFSCGAHFAMTQPIYDPVRFMQMVDSTSGLQRPILVGCMPLLSERNAEFLHNEVPGITLTDDVRKRMKGLSGTAGRQTGVNICKELVAQMVEHAHGFYIIPPQSRSEMAVELVDAIHQLVPRKL